MGWDLSVNHMIYAYTSSTFAYCNGTTSGIAPHKGVVNGSVEVVVERVGATNHGTMLVVSNAFTEGYCIPNSTSAVHFNIAGAVQRVIAEHIIRSEVYP